MLKSMVGGNGVVLPSIIKTYLGEGFLGNFFIYAYPFPIIAPSPTDTFRMIACFGIFSWCILYKNNSLTLSQNPSKTQNNVF